MRTLSDYFAVAEYDDVVTLAHRADALSDNNLSCARKRGSKSLSYASLGRGIYRARRVVEDNYLRLFKQCACDTETP